MENVKKLQRDMQRKVIGGVCAGLGNYLGIDAVLVRLLFVIALLCFSSGFWIYLILWLVMPASDGTQAGADFFVTPDGSAETPQGEGQKPMPNKGSLVAGLVLIGIGAVALLRRYVPAFNWSTIWPILLILLGLSLIIPFNKKKS